MFNVKWLVTGFAAGALVAAAPSCGGPSSKCNASTCQMGCCDINGKCQTPSNAACGQLGNLCQACGIGQFCNLGQCVGGSGGGSGGGTGGGGGSGGGTGGGTGGGVGGGTGGGVGGGTGGGVGGGTGGGVGGGTGGGVGGGAGGGAGGGTGGGGSTCSGCFAGTVCVQPPNNSTDSFCGTNGGACAQCNVAGGQRCVNFQCVGGTGGGTGGGGATGGGTGGGGGTTGLPIGSACTASTQCDTGLTCKMTTSRGDGTYTGGFCTKSCSQSTDCGPNAQCLGGTGTLLPYYGEAAALCVPTCASPGSQSTCRTGYTCYGSSSPGVCWLATVPPFDGGGAATKTGQTCSTHAQCQNPPSPDFGFCFTPTLSDGGVSGWTNGYCSADCSYDNTGTFCGPNGTCTNIGDATNPVEVCLVNCPAPGGRSNCRTGYTCFSLGSGTANGVCYPDCGVTGCTTGTCNTTTGQCQ